ncbi:winged helix-turn-helix transcriptional regulator [Methanolobus sp.]|jgi:uncharacterized membrane protein|uniref:helix-turn-helix transcriptional regulator n=1 Tax=Methanolobus sp. TaxID=1874737 RepID=UPI0025F9D9F8|nr:winged helix-turn-helix transcriptional regulator [Methanolobus sp.]
MKKRTLFSIICILLFIGVQFSSAAETATIHGAVYEWDSFDPLEHAIVEINSTPPQSMLANYGIYSFNLTPGNYTLSASYYSGTNLVSYTEEQITITDDGDYVMDMILLPIYYDASFNESEFSELDVIASFSDDDQGTISPYVIVFVFILLIGFIAGGYYFVKQRSAKSVLVNEDEYIDEGELGLILPDDKWQDLPDDLRQVINIIVKSDGRITQKDLRTKVKHSEAKVSLMVSDLESRGIVRKFKKGRGNVIILEDSESET